MLNKCLLKYKPHANSKNFILTLLVMTYYLFFYLGGVVDKPALFTVDTCGETGALGFSVEGIYNYIDILVLQ